MKYSLTIHDLNASQVTDLMNRVENAEITSVRSNNVVQLPPLGSPAAIAAAQNVKASGVTAEEMDEVLTSSTDELLKSSNTDERDSSGMTWDERIHSGSRKKNADGRWKLRKNVDEALVKQVESEQKPGLSGFNSLPSTGIVTPSLPPFLQNMSAGAPVTAPAIPVVPVAAPVPAPTVAPLARDFAGLMQQISRLFASKQITPDYPNTIVQRVNSGFGVNIASLTDVANDARMVEYSWQCLEVDGKAA